MEVEDGDGTPLLSPRATWGLGPAPPGAPRAHLLRLPSDNAEAGALPRANVVAHLLRGTSDDFWLM